MLSRKFFSFDFILVNDERRSVKLPDWRIEAKKNAAVRDSCITIGGGLKLFYDERLADTLSGTLPYEVVRSFYILAYVHSSLYGAFVQADLAYK